MTPASYTFRLSLIQTWLTSKQLGIFLCMRCASLHRKLGTHISKVKSLSMDGWSNEQVEVNTRVPPPMDQKSLLTEILEHEEGGKY